MFFGQKVVPFCRLNEVSKGIAIAFAKELLDGVGGRPAVLEHFNDLAVHWRKSLTDAEYAALPQEWCAMPALDAAGEGVVLETYA